MQNKVVAVTGGASGMGFALARLLLQRGASVSIADVFKPGLDEAFQELKSVSSPDKVIACEVDVRQLHKVQAWLRQTIDTFGQIDGAVNVAGVFDTPPEGTLFEDQDGDDWDWVLGVNLTGLANCLKSGLKMMERPGAIVNVASVSGLKGGWGSAAYTASKHGVVGLTRWVAKEYGPQGIRINAIAPGVIDTQMIKRAEGAIENGEEVFKRLMARLPIQRKGSPEEVAKLMMFLLSEDSSFITGAIYSIDGGINI